MAHANALEHCHTAVLAATDEGHHFHCFFWEIIEKFEQKRLSFLFFGWCGAL